MKKIIIISFLLLSCAAIIYFVGNFFWERLYDISGHHNRNQRVVTNFIEKDFPEIKDLGKAFLTLLVAVFVASITFSEKIVNHQFSSAVSKAFLFACWGLILVSIILVGVGLCFFYAAYFAALYENWMDYGYQEYGFFSYLGSGFSFGIALICMLYAAISSYVFSKKKNSI